MSSTNFNPASSPPSERDGATQHSPSTQSDEALLAELEALRREHAQLSEEWIAKDAKIEKLTASAVKNQLAVEVEEEKMANKLFKRLDEMVKNKTMAEDRLQRETEEKAAITSQVAVVHANLVEIENQIETEQNCILHKLQRELIEVSAKKAQVQRDLYSERGEYLRFMRQTLDKIIEKNPDLDVLASPVMSPTLMTVGGSAAAGGAAGGQFPPVLPPSAAAAAAISGNVGLQTPATMSVSVAQLQHELNTLLQHHCETEQMLNEDEMMCNMLAQMLDRVHQEVYVDRDRLMAMENGLKRVQADVAIAERGAVAVGAPVVGGGVSGRMMGIGRGVGGAGAAAGGGISVSNMSEDGDNMSSYACSTVATVTTNNNFPISSSANNILGVVGSRHSTAAATPTPTPVLMSAAAAGSGGGGGGSIHHSHTASNAALMADEDVPSGSFHDGELTTGGGAIVRSGYVVGSSPPYGGVGVTPLSSTTNPTGMQSTTSTMYSRGGGGGVSANNRMERGNSMNGSSSYYGSITPQRGLSNSGGVAPSSSAFMVPTAAAGVAPSSSTAQRQYHRLPSPSATSSTSSIAALRDHTQFVLTTALGSTPHTPHRGGSVDTPKTNSTL